MSQSNDAFSSAPSTPVLPTDASPVRRGLRVVIIGGGPGGYEAALVAAQLGAQVQLVEARGLGGSAVLTDVVPSKTLIATAEWLVTTEQAHSLGITVGQGEQAVRVNLGTVNARVRALAAEQSHDLTARMLHKGIEVVYGRAALGGLDANGERTIHIPGAAGDREMELKADVVLLATGARPRTLADAAPDGRRILTWTQLYDLNQAPEHLIVVGSGVTGAEFAGAYLSLGSRVTLVSSRDRVLPTVDADAAVLVESAFQRRGMEVLGGTRAVAARLIDQGTDHEGVEVVLSDGRTVRGSHCLMAVGAVPATAGLGLEEAGVELTESGHVRVDRVSRTTAYRVYAAGDCTGVLPLASVAAMQGQIAMRHALGDAVAPLETETVAQAVFTLPEIASVGLGQAQAEAVGLDAVTTTVPLFRNPRAKMQGVTEGFVKLTSERRSGVVLGGVVVAESASEQIFSITLAVTQRLSVEQVMNAFSVYPSVSGTVSEAARQLHVR
ncbi:NAD(P)H-quinone dehydrogenase [Actinomyces slackii]|nr:NAD(P)H-quinone dehydrogenase [Actinomyces slackii]